MEKKMFIEIEGQLLNLNNIFRIYKHDEYERFDYDPADYYVCLEMLNGRSEIIYSSHNDNERDEFYNKLKTQLTETK